jgi:acyl carrier protein
MARDYALTFSALLVIGLSGCGGDAPTPPAKNAPPRVSTAPSITDPSPQAVQAEVRKRAAKILQIKPEKLNPSTPLMSKEIGADELDMAEIVMEIEDAFDITIRDEDIGKSLKPLAEITVDEFARYVSAQLKSKEPRK